MLQSSPFSQTYVFLPYLCSYFSLSKKCPLLFCPSCGNSTYLSDSMSVNKPLQDSLCFIQLPLPYAYNFLPYYFLSSTQTVPYFKRYTPLIILPQTTRLERLILFSPESHTHLYTKNCI